MLDFDEAEYVARTIESGCDRDEFLRKFRDAVSPGFDPALHLERIGMANQTTMLSSESMAIAGRIGRAMLARYGREEAARRFRSFDTICSATQDRQDAVLEMMKSPPDLMVVIGGFNSSNTGHLAEICADRCPTWHVEGADDLLALDRIRHRPVGAHEPVEHHGAWLPVDATEIGLTAGASTPDREIGRVMARLLELRGIDPPA